MSVEDERKLNSGFDLALERYSKLLEHYKLGPKVQETAWAALMNLPPEEIIEKVSKYWQETFGNPKEDDSEANQETGLPPIQARIYQNRRDQRRRILETARSGRAKEKNRARNY